MSNSKKFYNRKPWARARRKAVIRAGFRCQARLPTGRICGADLTLGFNVHHLKSVKARPDLAMLPENHKPLCISCHARLEAQKRSGADRVQGCDVHGFPTGPDHPWNKERR